MLLYCPQLRGKTYFALSIKAISPEAIAAAAELAPKSPVQALLVSAVICK